MKLGKALSSNSLIITEGSMFERLRRSTNVKLDADLAHAALLYDHDSKLALEEAYRSYIDVGKKHNLPIIILSATWRANEKRIKQSQFKKQNLNADNIKFLQDLRSQYGSYGEKIIIGGLMGCCGDAYKASEALDTNSSEEFHAYQANVLAKAGADFLFGSTLPSTKEALGMAKAMAKTNTPYVLSFVIRSSGEVLDGIPLKQSIVQIDSVQPKPLGYFVNCVHPSTFSKAFENSINENWMKRIIGFQGNTSRKSPEKLALLADLETEAPNVLAKEIAPLKEKFGIKILGGCCGTNDSHIECIAQLSQY